MRPSRNNRCCSYRPEKTLSGEERHVRAGTSVKALDGVSFNLERGKTLAVVVNLAAVNRPSVGC